jgi:carboxypeptidase C (cathepsin A)
MSTRSICLFLTFLFTFSYSVSSQDIQLAADSIHITYHETVVNGNNIKYKASCGTQPVWNEDGKTIASLFYTYYERTDIQDQTTRPILISFNGGPGSASVWMHIAYTGPKILNIDEEGYPIQPYGIKDNPYSVIDVADIVFVNPVNTGYSRIMDKETDKKTFFGVNSDIKYLADWINNFITRNNRWTSPKYLIGESYGTTRVSGLALELQNKQWMYLNGVVLVSPTDLGIKRDGPVSSANRLPYYAATAWYHNKLNTELQNKSLSELLEIVEKYAVEKYIAVLAKGASLPEKERNKHAGIIASYAGISKKSVLQNNLNISPSFFWKELLREEGFTVGRLDSRYKGIDRQDSGVRPDFNSELTSWLHAFTPAINYYLRQVLGYKTDIKYNMFGPVHPWDRTGDRTGENLRQAMAQNPFLHVMVQSGYFDGATNYFDGKYSLWQLDPSTKMKDRLSFKAYESGHMMYLRAEDLRSSNDDLRQFILNCIPQNPAKY